MIYLFSNLVFAQPQGFRSGTLLFAASTIASLIRDHVFPAFEAAIAAGGGTAGAVEARDDGHTATEQNRAAARAASSTFVWTTESRRAFSAQVTSLCHKLAMDAVGQVAFSFDFGTLMGARIIECTSGSPAHCTLRSI